MLKIDSKKIVALVMLHSSSTSTKHQEHTFESYAKSLIHTAKLSETPQRKNVLKMDKKDNIKVLPVLCNHHLKCLFCKALNRKKFFNNLHTTAAARQDFARILQKGT